MHHFKPLIINADNLIIRGAQMNGAILIVIQFKIIIMGSLCSAPTLRDVGSAENSQNTLALMTV